MKFELKVDYGAIILLGRKQYSNDPLFVLLRETIQNSVDASATEIHVTLKEEENFLFLTVEDNGTGIEDFQEHFFSLGGSNKRDKEGNIGGFGVAKLSIFCADNWFVESKKYHITKEMLLNHLDVDELPKERIGTVIYCKIAKRDIYYMSYAYYVKQNLMVSELPCKIYFNDELITPITTSTYLLEGGVEVQKINETSGGYVKVRINGLYSFKKSVAGINDFVLDYRLSGNPYDDDYPLLSNREGFIEKTTESLKLITLCNLINITVNNQRVLEKKKEYEIGFVNGIPCIKKDYLDADSINSLLLGRCRKIMELIKKVFHFDAKVEIGYTGDINSYASYVPEAKELYGYHLIVVDPTDSKLNSDFFLLSTLLHEAVHMIKDIQIHDETFCATFTTMSSEVFKAVYDHQIKLQ